MEKQRFFAWVCAAALMGCMLASLALMKSCGRELPTEIPIQVETVAGKRVYFVDEVTQRIVVYCMNSGRRFPAAGVRYDADEVADPALAEKIERLLYAGYPNNGMGLYEIGTPTAILTLEQYKEILRVPAQLRAILPAPWGSYESLTPQNVVGFGAAVLALPEEERKTVLSTDFYNAAFCLESYAYEKPETAWRMGLHLYTVEFFDKEGPIVPRQVAYEATQNALWCLLYNEGVVDNALRVPTTTLQQDLLQVAYNGTLPPRQPALAPVRFAPAEGGGWCTGMLCIPKGIGYADSEWIELELPEGIQLALPGGQPQPGAVVRAGQQFCLYAAEAPGEGSIAVQGARLYAEALRKYVPTRCSPSLQNMLGLALNADGTPLRLDYTTAPEPTPTPTPTPAPTPEPPYTGQSTPLWVLLAAAVAATALAGIVCLLLRAKKGR